MIAAYRPRALPLALLVLALVMTTLPIGPRGAPLLPAVSALVHVIGGLFPDLAAHLATPAAIEPTTYAADGRQVQGLRADALAGTGLVPPPGLQPAERDAWLARGRRDGEDATVMPLTPFFPSTFTDPFVVEASGLRATLRPLGARPMPARVEAGTISYRDAYEQTDSLHVIAAGRSEEFLLLRAAGAPTRFEYELTPGPEVARVTLEEGAVRLSDATGRGLSIEAPWLIDADGQRRRDPVRWEVAAPVDGGPWRLTLVLDAATLRYPLVIDPSWSASPNMAAARYMHTATLLPDGTVLVAGGCCDGNGALATAEVYDPIADTWTATDTLAAGRFRHTATLLPNGTVLVVGGEHRSERLATAEIYDPTTRRWRSTGGLASGRKMHAAVLLRTGKVLVVGGSGPDDEALATAEVYDPIARTWSPTGGLTTGGRRAHTATLLQDGSVLVVGGFGDPNASIGTVERYDPATGAWGARASLGTPRSFHTATVLPDGRVLVVGGISGQVRAQGNAEVYTPGANAWAPTGPIGARYSHTATLLPDGRVLIAGGINESPLDSAVLFDPAGGWSATTSLRAARLRHTATLLPDGRVLITGGDTGAGKVILRAAERYDWATASWRLTTDVTGAITPMQTGRYNHTATLLPDGRVLVAGGYTVVSELYNPSTGSWSRTGDLPEARYRHVAILLPTGKVLVAGGRNGSDARLATAVLFDPALGTWSPTGSMATARAVATITLLANRKVLVAGGEPNNQTGCNPCVTRGAELYDPATGLWTPTSDLITGRSKHTATLLKNGKLLVVGGHGNNFQQLGSAELYDPVSGKWSSTGSLNTTRFYHSASLLSNGRVLVAGGCGGDCGPGKLGNLASAELYDPGTGQWTPTGAMTRKRQSHTATVLQDGTVLVVGGADADVATSTAEVFDPSVGTWRAVASLLAAPTVHANELALRQRHTATLLTTGQVLIAGGDSGPGVYRYRSTELYSTGLGFSDAWRPVLTGATSPLAPGVSLVTTGRGFRGRSGASGGNMGQELATDWPLLHLRSLVNEQAAFLPSDASNGWSDTTATARPLTTFPMGHALLTVLVNGIPSLSRVIWVETDPNFGVELRKSTTTLTTSITPAIFGQEVLFTAVVTASISGQGTPAGTVAFRDGGTVLCAAAPLNGAGVATCSIGSLAVGSHQITAAYTGTFLASQTEAALTQVIVADRRASAAIETNLANALVAQSVGLTARVQAAARGASTPGGSITFTDNGHLISGCQGRPVDGNGRAACPFSSSLRGDHYITAHYSGSHDFDPTMSAPTLLTVSIQRKQTDLLVERFESTAFASENNWQVFGQPAWASVSCQAAAGQRSAWAGGGSLPCGGAYSLDQQRPAYLIWKPFSLVNATAASISFSIRSSMQADDEFYLAVWTARNDYSNLLGLRLLGGGGTWQRHTLDLASIPTNDPANPANVNLLGEEDVSIALFFRSIDNSTGNGPFVDDVRLTATLPDAVLGVAPPWSFAEGYTGGTFDEYLTILNRSTDRVADANVDFFAPGPPIPSHSLRIPAGARATVNVNEVVGPGREVSARVGSTNGADLVVERPMYFDYAGRTGGHVAMGATEAATTWYFAEGYTGPGFDEFLTILNATASAATASIFYQVEGEALPRTRTVPLPAASRTTVRVHENQSAGNPGGLGRLQSGHATRVVSTLPVVVERPMYFTYSRDSLTNIDGGHLAMGVTAPRQDWYFAEGYTGQGFHQYLTIMNPNATPATVRIDYYLASGQTVVKSILVGATGRHTVFVNGTGEGVGLNKAVSAKVSTEHPDGIVVERPMYFAYTALPGRVTGGHTLAGAAGPRPAWYFAEGWTGAGFHQYLTIMNPNGSAADITITYAMSDGTRVVKHVTAGANSRRTVEVNKTSEGVGPDKAESATVTTTHPGGIIVERPMYFRYQDTITGGHVVMGYAPR